MKTMRRLTALFAALLLLVATTVSAAAETTEIPSNSFTLPGVQQRPEQEGEVPSGGEGETDPEPGGEETPEPEEQRTPALQYERGEDGALLLDENGDPIPVLAEGETAPAGYERDADGNLILDEDGNPIPKAETPEEDAEEPAEEPEAGEETEAPTSVEELLDGEQNVEITAEFDGEPGVGSKVTLHAVLSGFDGVVYTLQWQTSADGVVWSDVEGATQDTYTLTVTQENCYNQWRVFLTATDVL